MKRMWISTAAAALACLVAGPAGADGIGGFSPFRPLSPNHTNYGVAQLNYGTLPGDPDVIRFLNPGPVTQIAALLVYSRHLEGGRVPDTNPTEVFQGCLVRELTSHAALDIGEELVPQDDVGGLLSAPLRRYAEVIWAPVDPVRAILRLTRVADGLGGASFFSDDLQPHRLKTFKLSKDPAFAAKLREIIGLYVDPPAHAVVLSVDEKWS